MKVVAPSPAFSSSSMPRRFLEWSVWRQVQEPLAAGAGANGEWNKTYANITSTFGWMCHKVSPHLVFYQFLQRDLLVLLLLLLVFFQYEARGQRVSVHAVVSSTRTDPEPAVLIILNGVQEILAHLQKTQQEYEVRWFQSYRIWMYIILMKLHFPFFFFCSRVILFAIR